MQLNNHNVAQSPKYIFKEYFYQKHKKSPAFCRACKEFMKESIFCGTSLLLPALQFLEHLVKLLLLN
jgi:hypothetical protein